METKARLGAKGVGRKISGENDQYELREPQIPYSPLFTLEKCGLTYISHDLKIFFGYHGTFA
jgi:hypothetical protein